MPKTKPKTEPETTSAEPAAAPEAVAVKQENPKDEEVIDQALLDSIDTILSKLHITKVYFIDDAVKINTDKATFVGLIRSIIAGGQTDQLRAINIKSAIDFQTDEEVLPDHINQVWDDVHPGKQLKFYGKIFTIAGQPEAINDINVSHHLTNFFRPGLLACLTPNEWDDQCEELIAAIPDGERILILFDQDLKMAEGRFQGGVQGEQLILETKQRNVADKVVLALFTHTVPTFSEELPERQRICARINALSAKDFFVLTKSRLQKHDLFTDGLKKTCLNTFCEDIKLATVQIIQTAQQRTIDRLNAFDTYDFDETVFKSSFTEGVWEPETLLRITDVIFKDEVRTLMRNDQYVPQINSLICAAREVSSVSFEINHEEPPNIYLEKFRLRHQELYESQVLLNDLRRPIDNGDIFKITSGSKNGKIYILIAQECDLMVRSNGANKGKRGSKTAILAEIDINTQAQLFADMKRTYQGQIDKKHFTNHYFADRFKLEYFEAGTDKVGVVNFKDLLVIDLNVLDLIVFNPAGIAVLDLQNPTYLAGYHNFAWQNRYQLIHEGFTAVADRLDADYLALNAIVDEGHRTTIKNRINHEFSFIDQTGIPLNYNNRRFEFGIERISRLRLPKSKNLLDRYSLHLSRFAELHDFAS